MTNLPCLSKPQAVVLALWSFGMVVAKSCGLTQVSATIAALTDKKEDAVRQRLREWYRDKAHKKGEKRREIVVEHCFAPLLKWVLSLWPATERRIALALDATTLSDRWVVLVISVVYRGCAIPVAWVVLTANKKAAWKPYWLSLLTQIKASIPDDWFVLVTADRGLYANWLYQAIVDAKWHPFLRINLGGKYRPQGASEFRWLSQLITHTGQSWSGPVTCFKKQPLRCTLLASWEEGYEEPWLIVTDVSPEQADILWYSLRPWIECGFKHTKRGGWQWQYTRMTCPHRVTRFWLALAVATLWVLSVGGEADHNLPVSTLATLPEMHIARRRATRHSRPRLLSCFRRGICIILTSLIKGDPLPLGCFYPEPWPSTISFVNAPSCSVELDSS